MTDILGTLFGESPAVLFANFKFASVALPVSPEIKDDFYQSAPVEVRDIYSLHAITDGTPEEKLEIATNVMNRDAGFVVIPEGTVDDCLVDSKLFFGWFS